MSIHMHCVQGDWHMVDFPLTNISGRQGGTMGFLDIFLTGFWCIPFFGLMAYSFYEAQYIPDCWPDGRVDWRLPIGMICILGLATPANGIGMLLLLAMAIGSVPGMIYLPLKMRRQRWSERPNPLSKTDHKKADKLASEIDTLINKVGLPYQRSDGATDKGFEALMAPARLKAREYLVLTGENIERRIDMWKTIQSIACGSEEGELQA